MKQTVLIVSNLYKPNFGGIENSLYHLALSYQKLGFHVVICASDINSEGLELPSVERCDGADIVRYQVNKYRSPFRFPLHCVNGVKALIKIRKQYKPDVVISRYHLSSIMLRIAGYRQIKYLVPGVVKYQNTINNLVGKQRSWIDKLRASMSYNLNVLLQYVAIKMSSELFVFSQNMRNQLKSLNEGFGRKISVTKPGVDLQRFKVKSRDEKRQTRHQLGLPTDKPVFLAVGRFVKAKGFDLAIEAMRQVNNSELWILGDGVELDNYNMLIDKYNLRDRVKLLPSSKNPEQFYSAADFFVMSSRYEPLGQTILEALASGLPIVAFKTSDEVETATVELVGHTDAYYSSKLDANALSEAIQEAVKEYNSEFYENYSQKMLNLAKERFSWETLCEDLLVNNTQ